MVTSETMALCAVDGEAKLALVALHNLVNTLMADPGVPSSSELVAYYLTEHRAFRWNGLFPQTSRRHGPATNTADARSAEIEATPAWQSSRVSARGPRITQVLYSRARSA